MIEKLIRQLGNTQNVKIEITPEDFMEVIQNVAKRTSEEMIAMMNSNDSQELVTRQEAMRMLNVKTTLTMLRWEEKGFLKPHRIGSRIFYVRNEIVKAVEEFTRERC